MHPTRREPVLRRTKDLFSLMRARQVALFMAVTLDGFFEGPNHQLDWHLIEEHPVSPRPAAKRLATNRSPHESLFT